MNHSPFYSVMNTLYGILQSNPTENIVDLLMQHAAVEDRTTAMLAICSLLTIENARRCHADRHCAELEQEVERLKRYISNNEMQSNSAL